MKTVSIKYIQELDRIAIEGFGIPSLVLMENAGRLAAEEVKNYLKDLLNPIVTVVCGLGNNAGDGFVTARYLLNANMDVNVFLIGSNDKLKNDAKVNYQILKKLGVNIKEVKNKEELDFDNTDVIVDAIFGVGLNRQIKGLFKEVIAKINQFQKWVVSVDIPSGLNADTGDIYNVCVQADVTATFTFAKQGFEKNQAVTYTGQVKVLDIGIPQKIIHSYYESNKNKKSM